MKALAVTPLQKNSLRIIDHMYKPGEVLVKVLDAGICRTDHEIIQGLYGEAPKHSNYLVIGHESLGQVVSSSLDLKEGDYVTRMVRRGCLECYNCGLGYADMCSTGNYTEAGIKGVHGVMSEFYTDRAENLVLVPEEFANVGVLVEPLSVVEKATRHAYEIQQRLEWNPETALVLGAGPIGLLETMLLRLRGLNTQVVARSESGNKAEIVQSLGGHYVCLKKFLEGRERFDFIYEASGNVNSVALALDRLNPNGVLCLSSITGGDEEVKVPLERINLEMVLGNKLIFGAVNAGVDDWYEAVDDLSRIDRAWPGVLNRLITGVFPVEAYKEAFVHKPNDIKTLISFR